MPELPEVEVIVRSLNKNIIGSTIKEIKINYEGVLRNFLEFQNLIGEKFEKVERCGKYIVIHFQKKILMIHLRMTGKVLVNGEINKHTHVIIYLNDGKIISYNDIRKFGTLEVFESIIEAEQYLHKRLGLEPLKMDCQDFYEKIKTKKMEIKSILLEQKVIAGLGNIYCDEVLFKSKISPLRLGVDINEAESKILCQNIKSILLAAIDKGGSSINDYVNSEGSKGSYQKEHQAYGRWGEPCLTCGNIMSKVKLKGRTTSFCDNCQK